MFKKSKYILLPLVLIAFVFTLCIEKAAAEIAIGPLTKTIQLAPGENSSVVYKVANQGEESVVVNVGARTWFRLPDNSGIEIGDWLDLGSDKIKLDAGQEKDLKFKVSIPKEAVGELAAMIYFAPERTKEQTIGTSYGASFYVFIKGTEDISPEISRVSIDNRNNKSYLAVTMKNNGNVHFRPKISATVRLGKDLIETIELPFGKPIFGGQDYTFAKELSKQLPEKGICTVEVSCNYADSDNTVLNKTVNIDLGKSKEKK